MRRAYRNRWLCWIVTGTTLLGGLPGCHWTESVFRDDREYFRTVATQIDYPDVGAADASIAATPPPITIADRGPTEYWDLTLQEAVRIALENNRVMRDLGTRLLDTPDSVSTVFEPSLQETDARFGVEAALSEFDASLASSVFYENNDRPLNNPFFTGGRALKQDLIFFNSEITKRNAQGSEFFFRTVTDFDQNNTPGNPFDKAWNISVEGEVRQPLLRGFGLDVNRIAGTGNTPGVYNGVLVARINTDVSLTDFEMSVRDLISDVENVYWDLYFSYRDLDAKIAARDRALAVWRQIHADPTRAGHEADKESQAREQYFRAEEDVQNALTGRRIQRTSTNAFLGNSGVHLHERRLRLMMGVPITDGALIRPATEPVMARVVYPWTEILPEALNRRVEVRRQKWLIKRAELELIASRNYLLPQLDVVGLYRFRGFGRNLLGVNTYTPPGSATPSAFPNALGTLSSLDFQEGQLGVEYRYPIGFRKAHAGVRNAQLLLSRQRAMLDAQEREISHDLAEAIGEMERAYATAQTNLNRRQAAQQALAEVEARYELATEREKTTLLALLLDVQRRLADAESLYFRSLAEYALGVKHVHYVKGSLLDYNEILLTEGPWPRKAYADAARRERLRARQWTLANFVMARGPEMVTRGATPQQTEADLSAAPGGYYMYDENAPRGEARGDGQPGGARLDTPGYDGNLFPAPPEPLPGRDASNRPQEADFIRRIGGSSDSQSAGPPIFRAGGFAIEGRAQESRDAEAGQPASGRPPQSGGTFPIPPGAGPVAPFRGGPVEMRIGDEAPPRQPFAPSAARGPQPLHPVVDQAEKSYVDPAAELPQRSPLGTTAAEAGGGGSYRPTSPLIRPAARPAEIR